MPERLPMIERVLALFPEEGKRIPYGELCWRAKQQLHISAGDVGKFVSELCTAHRAISETIDGWGFVRRYPKGAGLVLLPRPRHPVPRLRRTVDRPRSGTLIKRAAGWR